MKTAAEAWSGVFVSLTTAFHPDGVLDLSSTVEHAGHVASCGVQGLLVGGGLGEGSSLSSKERRDLFRACSAAVGPLPVIGGIWAESVDDALAQSAVAMDCGCAGILLPCPSQINAVHDVESFYSTVLRSHLGPTMIYSDALGSGHEISPECLDHLMADFAHLRALKESSTSAARFEALQPAAHRISIFIGLDTMLSVGLENGATGWISGLGNAVPHISQKLWEGLSADDHLAGAEYLRLTPIFALDIRHEYIELIKWYQHLHGLGNGYPRPPRQTPSSRDKLALEELILLEQPHERP